MGVKELANFDPKSEMDSLATLAGATASDNDSVANSANAARTGQQMITLKSATIKSALSGLNDIDDGNNKMIDVNSMMDAMDDYINRSVSGGDNIGVPVNYYLKPVTQSMIARAWLAKYYPNKYNKAGSADDSNSGANQPSDSGNAQ
jgi:hypothetical protein